jgi:hypothetical protein
MARNIATDADESPRDQTVAVCDAIRDELDLEEHEGKHTLTQTEKRRILNALQD